MSTHSSQPLALVVLAAGMGSRYGGLKQLDPVGPAGEVILDYSVYDAMRAGFTKVVFVIRRDFQDEFRRNLGCHFEERLDADYVFQELEAVPPGFVVPEIRRRPWGTAHAVLTARRSVDSPFGVINADDFYGQHSYAQLAAFLRSAAAGAMDIKGREPYAMVGFRLRNTLSEHGSVARGLCRCDESGFLRSVREVVGIGKAQDGASYEDETGRHALTGDELVSMNMWGFVPSVFDHLERLFAAFLRDAGQEDKAEFYIPSAVDRLIREGVASTRVLATDSRWFGVTYREDKPHVEASIRDLTAAGAYPPDLWRTP